jgi:hypothetical protein
MVTKNNLVVTMLVIENFGNHKVLQLKKNDCYTLWQLNFFLQSPPNMTTKGVQHPKWVQL